MPFIKFIDRLGISGDNFADACGFHRDLVAEWLSRKRYPARSDIQRAALAFGVAVSELLSPSAAMSVPTSERARAFLGLLHLSDCDAEKHFRRNAYAHWGWLNLGLLDLAPRWYPISLQEAAKAYLALSAPRTIRLIGILTRNNRALVFDPDQMAHVQLHRDDDSEIPAEARAAWDGQGLPPPVYEAASNWAHSPGESLMDALELRREVARLRAVKGLYTKSGIIARIAMTRILTEEKTLIELWAEPANMRTAFAALPAGAESLFLRPQLGEGDLLLSAHQIMLLDMPRSEMERYRWPSWSR